MKWGKAIVMYHVPWIVGIILCLICGGCLMPDRDETIGWVPLFDGETLNGWEATAAGNWTVANRTISSTLTSGGPDEHLLLHGGVYEHFVLKCFFRVMKGNTSLLFQYTPQTQKGYAAELSAQVGGVREMGEQERWVPADTSDIIRWFEPDQWNELTVRVEKNLIVVEIDDYETVRLAGNLTSEKGQIGFRLRGEAGSSLRLRDISIVELPEMLRN